MVCKKTELSCGAVIYFVSMQAGFQEDVSIAYFNTAAIGNTFCRVIFVPPVSLHTHDFKANAQAGASLVVIGDRKITQDAATNFRPFRPYDDGFAHF